MKKNTGGFTVVELLVVIVVIAILAAITIVSYMSIQNRANDAVIQSDFRNIAQAMELFRIDNGTYPVASQLSQVDIKVTKGAYDPSVNNVVYCISSQASGRNAWIMIGQSKSGTRWSVGNDHVPRQYTGTWSSGMTTICSAALENGGADGNAWGYAGGPPRIWYPWVR